MALRAVLGETRLNVVGIRRIVIVLQVATDTLGGSPGESSAGVALHAIQMRMSTHQRETSQGVIESFAPIVHAMARLALGRERSRLVVDCPGSVVIVEVAEYALGAEPPVQSYGCTLVAFFALGGRMRSQKREPVFMSIHAFCNLAPSPDRVAQLAIISHLPAMDVCMAIGAASSGF